MGCILYRQSNEKSTALLCISAAICSFWSCPAKPARLVPAGIFACFNSGSALRFAPSTNRYGGSAGSPRRAHPAQHPVPVAAGGPWGSAWFSGGHTDHLPFLLRGLRHTGGFPALRPRCPQRLVIIADWQAFVNTFFEVFLIKYGNNEATSIKYRATQEMTKYMRFCSGLPQRFGCKNRQ